MASRSKRSRRPSARLEEGVLCRWMDHVRDFLLKFAPMQCIETGIQRSDYPLAAFEDVPARSGPKVSFVYKLLKPSDLKPSLVSRSVRGLLSRAVACYWLESSCPRNCVRDYVGLGREISRLSSAGTHLPNHCRCTSCGQRRRRREERTQPRRSGTTPAWIRTTAPRNGERSSTMRRRSWRRAPIWQTWLRRGTWLSVSCFAAF